MKKLKLESTGIRRIDVPRQAYKLDIRISESENITKEVFVKQRLKTTDNNFSDVFVAVASPAQIEDLPPHTPATDTSYFRVSEISLVNSDPSYLQWILDTIKSELNTLLGNAEALEENGTTLTWCITAANITAGSCDITTTTTTSTTSSTTTTTTTPP